METPFSSGLALIDNRMYKRPELQHTELDAVYVQLAHRISPNSEIVLEKGKQAQGNYQTWARPQTRDQIPPVPFTPRPVSGMPASRAKPQHQASCICIYSGLVPSTGPGHVCSEAPMGH